MSGSMRGRSSTGVWTRYCGTAAKAGGQQRTQTSSCSSGRLLPTRRMIVTSLSKRYPFGARVSVCGASCAATLDTTNTVKRAHRTIAIDSPPQNFRNLSYSMFSRVLGNTVGLHMFISYDSRRAQYCTQRVHFFGTIFQLIGSFVRLDRKARKRDGKAFKYNGLQRQFGSFFGATFAG